MTDETGRGYRLLLRLLPRDLRETFGADMEQLHRDRLREAPGPMGRMRVRLEAIRDVTWQAALEWIDRARDELTTTRRQGMGMDGWVQDLRFGARSLLRRPGFSAAAVATLALGIGANVAIFSVVDAVLLEPLPYPDSDDLVVLWTAEPRSEARQRGIDHPDIRLIQEQVPELDVAGYAGTRPTLTGFGDPQVVFGARVTDGLIDLMGLTPELGRDLRATDDVPGGPAIVVVSHAFWTQRLGQDREVVGRSITLNGESWEIVGVAPPGFDFPSGSELWFPQRHEADDCGHGCRFMNAVGRIAPDSDFREVSERVLATSLQLAEDFPDSHRDERFELQSMLEYEVSDVRTALLVLLGAVGMVLLIACANVANLMLVRASARQGEVALRATLGASRLRIVRQLLTESLLLAVAAGVVGIALAYWGTTALVALAPESLPRLDGLSMDVEALGFAAALVLVVTAAFGVIPAVSTARTSQGSTTDRRRAGDRHSDRSRSILLVAEVALSLTLLLGTGLLIRTLGEIRSVDLGFDTEGVERFRISLPGRYDSLAVGDFLMRMETELEGIPGVAAAGWGFGVPLASGNIGTSVSFLDRPILPPPDRAGIEIRPASPGFLQATGTRLLRGRWIEESDRYGAPGVAVINDAAARAYFPDNDPIGVQMEADISWGFAEFPPVTIVGVVEDVIRSSPTEPPSPAAYLSNFQFGANTGYVSLRLEPGVATVIPEARSVVASMDPSLAIWDEANMEDVVRDASASTAFFATLLTVFSIVALLLAAVGLYGVVAYSVAQRTREIGIRIALGAAADDVTGMVVRQGIRPAIIGIVLGLVASWFVTRLFASMLFGVTWQDPITLAGVTGALLLVAIAATAIPALRAARVPPSDALRAE